MAIWLPPTLARRLLQTSAELLGTPRGSYKAGSKLDVAFVSDGDEIDLAGFLPVRFRLQG